MPRHDLIAESTTPDGEALTLTFEGGEHVVRVRGELLMSSRQTGSEQAMARLAFKDRIAPEPAQLLVAGLGMGFTLRALLDQVGASAQIELIELLGDVVTWNRGPLAGYANHPLNDPRVQVTVSGLLDYLAITRLAFDAILIDIDNGPEAFTVATNERVYAPAGLAALRNALVVGGVLVLWSAFKSPRFEQSLRQARFAAHSETVRARGQIAKGARHTLFVATRTPGG
jgi:spermidine synthase